MTTFLQNDDVNAMPPFVYLLSNTVPLFSNLFKTLQFARSAIYSAYSDLFSLGFSFYMILITVISDCV